MQRNDAAEIVETLEDDHLLWFHDVAPPEALGDDELGALSDAGVDVSGDVEVSMGNAYTWDADGRWSACLLVLDGDDEFQAAPWRSVHGPELTDDPQLVLWSLRHDSDHWIEDYDTVGSAVVDALDDDATNVPWEEHWLDGTESLDLEDGRTIETDVARRGHLDLSAYREA